MNKYIEQLKCFEDNLLKLSSENINNLNLSKTELFIIDMNNGFAKSGLLYSNRVNNLISPIVDFTYNVSDKIKKTTAFIDSHTKDSIELLSYPSHCLKDSIESDIIDELKSIKNIHIIPKNSTNAFFVLDDVDFKDTENIIIIGDCTDICIYQFAITLKSYFNQNNMNKNIIIPTNLIDTYDSQTHPADLLNLVFLNSLIQNGINVVSKIVY